MKSGKKLIAWVSTLLLMLSMAIPIAAAEQDLSVVPIGKTGSISISYKNTDGNVPVKGAEFTCYRIGECKFSYINGAAQNQRISLIDGVELNEKTSAIEIEGKVRQVYEKTVEGGAVYTGTTDANGRLLLREVRQGIYLVAETKPAAGYFASAPFLLTLPFSDRSENMGNGSSGNNNGGSENGVENGSSGGTAGGSMSEMNTFWNYNVQCEPKPLPAGELKITKKVQGNSGEKNRDFHFQIHIGKEGEYRCKKSDGSEGRIKADDVVTLRDGQSIQIYMIPAGVEYKVSEQEAGKDGYTTVYNGAVGHIAGLKTAEVSFTNTRDTAATPTPTSTASGPKGNVTAAPVKTGDPFRMLGYALLLVGSMAAFLWVRRLADRENSIPTNRREE